MRILMLTQWFQPEPMFKGLPFAKELLRRGHKVEVLTGFPNYPGGKVYNGYRVRPWLREEMEGIWVNRVALYPSHGNSGICRIANYMSFAFMTLLIGPWLIHKPDVVYVYNLVPLSRTASFLRWFYGCKIVYDVQDLWPESVVLSGMLPGFLHGFFKRWCHKAYQRADFIVAQSPGFQKKLQSQGVSPKKIGVIYNWCQEETFYPELDDKILDQFLGPDRENTFNVVFAGTMGVMQGLDTVLEAAEILSKSHRHVRFFLVGGGVAKKHLQDKSKDMGLGNIIFVPRQPMSAMGSIFKIADALLVHLKEGRLFKITIPSKTQAYLAAGKPIVMAVEGDAADLVVQARAGYVCAPEDARAMAECVKKLCEMPLKERNLLGENGGNFYKEKLSFKRGVSKFESVFEYVLKGVPKGNYIVAEGDQE